MSKINSEPIDIVVPWVNPNDEQWFRILSHFRKTTSGEKDDIRFRDLDVFRYWFRGIDNYMPWVRYVFLILASPSQIPAWLNTEHSKLKIIYHKDFIPASELPTFNSSVINCYVPYIEELSDNYILFNDDMFIMKPQLEENWFKNDLPVYFLMHERYQRNGKWSENIVNSKTLASAYTGITCDSNPEHGPIANKKMMNMFFFERYKANFQNALGNSRFRTAKNVTDWIYFFFCVPLNKFYENKTSRVLYWSNEKEPKQIKDVVCFNDSSLIKNFDAFKVMVRNFLNNRFPNKCRFEK
jgi:hypothetical protein